MIDCVSRRATAIFMALALAATMCAAPLSGLARADDDPHGMPAAKGSASGAPHAWFDAFSSELAASASEPSSTGSVRVILEFAPSQDGLDAQAVRDAGLEDVSKTLGRTVEAEETYDAVFIGCAVTLTYEEAFELAYVPSLANAFVEHEYAAPEPAPAEDAVSMQSLRSAADPEGNLTSNGQGKGLVVAVIDSGAQIDHEALRLTDDSTGRLTEADIDRLKSEKGLGGAYGNAKVPYVYDYAGRDADVFNPGNNHGMHVAGIVAANSGKVQGVAPEAQLVIMKIFGDNDSGGSAGYVKAIDDALKLDVDAINMSIGLPAAGQSGNERGLDRALEAAQAQGVSVAVSAGNESRMGLGAVDVPSTDPDYGVVASPSIAGRAIAVASSDNDSMVIRNALRLTSSDGEVKGVYACMPKGKPVAFDTDYGILDCNFGSTADFKGKTFGPNQYALVKRGGTENGIRLTFQAKAENALAAGAAGVIVYDAESTELFAPGVETAAISIIAVPQNVGLALAADPAATWRVSEGYVSASLDTAGKPSSFSAWGVSPEFDLKPEIMATGGHVFSLDNNGGYTDLQGTSMASPQVAGSVALLRAHLSHMGVDKANLSLTAKNVLMSTAVPTKNAEDVYYSPRKQGAGQMDLFAALAAKAYLVDPRTGESKVMLGNLSKGEATFDIEGRSLDGQAREYDLAVYVGTDGVNEGRFTFEPNRLSSAAAGTLSIGEGGTGKASVSFDVTASEADLSAQMPNGYFLEGYVIATSREDSSKLVIPFVGFRGSWEKVPLFEDFVDTFTGSKHPLYDRLETAPSDPTNKDVDLFTHFKTGVNVEQQGGFGRVKRVVVGELTPEGATHRSFSSTIAFSPNGDRQGDYLELSAVLLRNYRDLEVGVYADAALTEKVYTGNPYEREGRKNFGGMQGYASIGKYLKSNLLYWTGVDDARMNVEDGTYYVALKARPLAGDEYQTLVKPVIVDTKPPILTRASGGAPGEALVDATDDGSGIRDLVATVKGSEAKVPVSLRNGSYVLDVPAGVEPSDIDVTATDCAYNATTRTVSELVGADDLCSITYEINDTTGKDPAIQVDVTLTNAAGEAELDPAHLVPGRYTLSAKLHGYWKDDVELDPTEIEVEVGPGKKTEHVVFNLRKSTTVTYVIVDYALNEAAHAKAGIGPYDKITDKNVHLIDELGTPENPILNVGNLKGLEDLPALTSLHLKDGMLYSTSLLPKLSHLEKLGLVNKKLDSASFAKSLRNLKELDLTDNDIARISSDDFASKADGKASVADLVLDGNRIEDVSVLASSGIGRISALHQRIAKTTDQASIAIPLTSLDGSQARIVATDDLAVEGNVVTITHPQKNTTYETSFDSADGVLSGTLRITFEGENVGPQPPDQPGVAFEDATVARAVAEALHLPEGSSIPESRLQEVTALGSKDEPLTGIATLSDLAKLPNLCSISMAELPERLDLAPLGEAPLLNNVGIERTPGFDPARLPAMPGLKTLRLTHDGIADISSLARFTKLDTLDLTDNAIESIEALASMPELSKAFLGGNRIADISPLSENDTLTSCYLTGNRVKDFSPLGRAIAASGSYTINALMQQSEAYVEGDSFESPLKDKDGKPLALSSSALVRNEDGTYSWPGSQDGDELAIPFATDDFRFNGTLTLHRGAAPTPPDPEPDPGPGPEPGPDPDPEPSPDPTPDPTPSPGEGVQPEGQGQDASDDARQADATQEPGFGSGGFARENAGALQSESSQRIPSTGDGTQALTAAGAAMFLSSGVLLAAAARRARGRRSRF